jgi:hypothetical protein
MTNITKDIVDDRSLRHRQKAKRVSAHEERDDIINRRLPKRFQDRGFF